MHDFQPIADGIWLYPFDDHPQKAQPNVGIICTPTQTVLIDAGNSPRQARSIQSSLASLGAPPLSFLIYTHHHWDHVFGAIVYTVQTIVAHELCANRLKPMLNKSWSHSNLREEIYKDPRLDARNTAMGRAIDDWRGFRVCMPTLTFTRNLTIHLDGLTIELEHIGGRHAEDSIVVKVPERGVMFIGDCFYPPPIHERLFEDDVQLNTTLLQSLAKESYHTYIDGHSSPHTIDQLRAALGDGRW